MDFNSWFIKLAKKSLPLGNTGLKRSERLGSLLGSDLRLTPNAQSSSEKVPCTQVVLLRFLKKKKQNKTRNQKTFRSRQTFENIQSTSLI